MAASNFFSLDGAVTEKHFHGRVPDKLHYHFRINSSMR
jgi:hypothetical protein